MSPRAASRLASLGFEQVYDYVAGKADWGSAGLPLEGEEGSETRAGAHLRADVPTCRLDDRLHIVCERLDESGWDTCFVVDERRVVLGRIGRRLVTFHVVCLAWVFFRAESFGSAFDVLGRLATGWGEEAPLVTPLVVLAIGGMLLLQNLPRTPAARLQLVFSRAGPVLQGAAFAIVLFAITAVGPSGVAPFIYFRF